MDRFGVWKSPQLRHQRSDVWMIPQLGCIDEAMARIDGWCPLLLLIDDAMDMGGWMVDDARAWIYG